MPGPPVDVLQRVPLLADLTVPEFRQIARLLEKRRFDKDETVVQEG